jgi:hypothetical protein
MELSPRLSVTVGDEIQLGVFLFRPPRYGAALSSVVEQPRVIFCGLHRMLELHADALAARLSARRGRWFTQPAVPCRSTSMIQSAFRMRAPD